MARRVFHYSDDVSHKFWSIDLDGSTQIAQWGRIGTTGQMQTKEFASADAAQAACAKLIAEKVRKGYIEVTAVDKAEDAIATAQSHLGDAFAEGITVTYGGEPATLVRRYIADLVVPTGTIVACDPPTIELGITPLTVGVPPGCHPIVLTLARWPSYEEDEGGAERVAYATLQVRDQQPARWEVAALVGHDAVDSAYGVDTGTACFMDVEAARVFLRRMAVDSAYAMIHEEAMAQVWGGSWSWADVQFEPETAANMITFSAGTGDGAYWTFAGYDTSNKLVCLTTDFQVLWPGEEP